MADGESVHDLSEDIGNLSVKDGPCVGVIVDGSGGSQHMTAGAMAPVTPSQRSHITTEEEGVADIAATAGHAMESGSSEAGDPETPADVSPPARDCPVGHVACGSDTARINVEVTDASPGGFTGDIPAGCVECGDVASGHMSELQETCVNNGQGDSEVGHNIAKERERRQDLDKALTNGKPATGSDVLFGHVTVVTTACQAESDRAPTGGCNAVGSDAGGGASAGWQPQSSEDCHPLDKDDPTNYRKLFVGNIGYKKNWRELKNFFSQFGNVVYAQIVIDRAKRRSEGIGFVEFATEEEAMNCSILASCPGLILEGRKLRVDYATESWVFREGIVTKRPREPRTTPDYQPAEPVVRQGEEDKSSLLNVDEWAMIFSYLTVPEQITLERVCKRWRDMALLVWKLRTSLKLRMTCADNFFKADKLVTSVLSRCGPFLSCLDLWLSASYKTMDYCLTIIGEYCPQLKKLNLAGHSFKTIGIKNLSKAATDLTWINLHNCRITEKPLWWLLKNCRKLEHLDISDNWVTGKCFYLVGPHLRSLNASDCYQLTDYCVESMVQKCPNIRELRLGSCVSLTQASLVALAKLTCLEVLDLSHTLKESCYLGAPWTLLGNLHNLRELRLDHTLIRDDVLQAVAQGCPKLQILTLQGRSKVTREGLQFLLDLEELSTLDVSYIDGVDDAFLERLSAPGRLQSLTLRICPGISDAGVQRVLEQSPGLRHLDLSGCFMLSPDALYPLTISACMVNPPPHHSLTVFLGGIFMAQVESPLEHLTAMKSELLPHVNLLLYNQSNRQYAPGSAFSLLFDDDFEDENYCYEENDDLEFYNQPLHPAGNIGQREDDIAEAGEEGAYGPPVPEDSANRHWRENEDWSKLPVEEDWSKLPVEEDWSKLPVEEDWGAEVNPPGPTVPVQVMADNLRAYDDFFDDDEDYDEFLVNDDPLEMERWDLS